MEGSSDNGAGAGEADTTTTGYRIDCSAQQQVPADILQRFPKLRLLQLYDSGDEATQELRSVTYFATIQEPLIDDGLAFVDMFPATMRSRLKEGDKVSSFAARGMIAVGSVPKDFESASGNAERAAFVRTLLPAWELGPTETRKQLHVTVKSFAVWQRLVADMLAAMLSGASSLLAELLRAQARIHLVTNTRINRETAALLNHLHSVSVYLPPDLDARRDLMPVFGDALAAFAAAPTLRHVWFLFTRQQVWDPPLDEILKSSGCSRDVNDLPARFGLCSWHNCHHRWEAKTSENYDEAAFSLTRIHAITQEDAAVLLAEVSKEAFARRDTEHCSLYRGPME